MKQTKSPLAYLAPLIGGLACGNDVPGVAAIETSTSSSGEAEAGSDSSCSHSMDGEDRDRPLELVIDHPLVLCGYDYTAVDGSTFPQTVELARRLTIMPGRYPLPEPVVASPDDPWPPLSDPDIQHSTDVPLCMTLEDRNGAVAFSVETPIRAETVLGTYSVFEFNNDRLNVGLRGTLRMPNGERWNLGMHIDHELYEMGLTTVHVVGGDLEHARGRHTSLQCRPDDSDSGLCNADLRPSPVTTTTRFYECSFPWSPTFEWRVRYPAGTATFDVQMTVPRHAEIDDWFPLILVGSSGVHEGNEWIQNDPLRGTTIPNARAHDPIMPTFAVLFPEPMDGACGIATGLGSRMKDDGSYMSFPEVYTFDCDYQRLDAWEADLVENVERPQ